MLFSTILVDRCSDVGSRGNCKMYMEKAACTFSGSWKVFKEGEAKYFI
jgi:hypothetical protein